MKQQTSTKGFTIIEVVLVLAIAALIFLVVFLAVPALQRSQRDNQRRQDLGRLNTAIINYAGNHNGTNPTITSANSVDWINQYVRANGKDTFMDPRGNTAGAKGEQYILTIDALTTPASYTDLNNTMTFRDKHQCDPATGGTTATTSSRNFAVLVGLESGNSYCMDNR
ncbi:MAG: type II secretion system protein [Acidobacteriota bacterium]